ncbi:MAG: hypothetical protein GF334_10970 [Candidatus Altiarchaeales archaeon]|nr:hypothetical protein [Candidatus Altiarchaeales archaeon]
MPRRPGVYDDKERTIMSLSKAKYHMQGTAEEASRVVALLQIFETGKLFKIQSLNHSSTHIVQYAYLDTYGPHLILKTLACSDDNFLRLVTREGFEGHLAWRVGEIGGVTHVPFEDIPLYIGWQYISESFREILQNG